MFKESWIRLEMQSCQVFLKSIVSMLDLKEMCTIWLDKPTQTYYNLS